MKKIFSLLFLTAVFAVNAQSFQGMAVYESKTSVGDFKMKMPGMTPEMEKSIMERMKKMFEKTYILNFDRTQSIYKEEEKLDVPGQNNGGKMMSSMMGGGGTFYKDTKAKTFTVDKDMMGKEFLIQDSLPNLKWKMEGETKVIGGYNCFKATAEKPVNKSDFRNFRPKTEKAGDDAAKKKDDASSTNFMDQLEMPDKITITAWYTPEIPVAQGPENYWGLPGLILEASDGKTTILCSKVVMNVKDRAEIKAPKGGKVVTQAEYDKIVAEKMEEMQQMGGRGGNGAIRIGR